MSDAEHSDVEEFETADAGASTTVPMQAGSVRKGGFMVIKGRPTKVCARQNCKSRDAKLRSGVLTCAARSWSRFTLLDSFRSVGTSPRACEYTLYVASAAA